MRYLTAPPSFYSRTAVDPLDMKVGQWLVSWDGEEEMDVGVIGIPLSRSSISASGASESPLAIRQHLRSFSLYDADHDVDLTPLRVRDLGDIVMHTTDILRCHEHIEKGIVEAMGTTNFFPLLIGGDHSITCPAVKAFAACHPEKKVGLIQWDTHFDVRSLQTGGPSNGTPIRGLIESKTLCGEHIYQVGIHGFANSYAYCQYVKEQGIRFFTMQQVRKEGVEVILSRILKQLSEQVDIIYVTVDMDVLDISVFPGSPGAHPGGMASFELFEALFQLGMQEKVGGIDFVCFDPLRDIGLQSTKTTIHAILSFLSGYRRRKERMD